MGGRETILSGTPDGPTVGRDLSGNVGNTGLGRCTPPSLRQRVTAKMMVGMTSEFWSRGGNDREIENPGNMIGDGVAAGSERAGGVLGPCPSSPNTKNPPFSIPEFAHKDHSRLKTKPLTRAARTREEVITLENMIFRKSVEKKAVRPEGLENESGGESHSG